MVLTTTDEPVAEYRARFCWPTQRHWAGGANKNTTTPTKATIPIARPGGILAISPQSLSLFVVPSVKASKSEDGIVVVVATGCSIAPTGLVVVGGHRSSAHYGCGFYRRFFLVILFQFPQLCSSRRCISSSLLLPGPRGRVAIGVVIHPRDDCRPTKNIME